MWLGVIALFWHVGIVTWGAQPLIFSDQGECYAALSAYEHAELEGPDNPDGTLQAIRGYCIQVIPPRTPKPSEETSA